jgi:dTDP-4-dehydrorhamnose reductase
VRLLVTGANGQVGWELARNLSRLGEVATLRRRNCDLSRPDRLPYLIRSLKPDVVVNAAAYTAVDDAERDEALATTVNATAVGVLAEAARREGALFVHYSTAYVFDGRKDGPYTEEDQPCPVNAYGRSKLEGEVVTAQAGGDYLILRTNWVYSPHGRNFLRSILQLLREREELQIVADHIGVPRSAADTAHLLTVCRQLREREELRVLADHIGAPTSAAQIARATAAVIDAAVCERVDGRFAPGLFHLTAAGATSWHGFASAVVDGAARDPLLGVGNAPRLIPITTEDDPRPAARPRNSRLACDRLRQRFGVALPFWKNGLSLCLREMRICEPA